MPWCLFLVCLIRPFTMYSTVVTGFGVAFGLASSLSAPSMLQIRLRRRFWYYLGPVLGKAHIPLRLPRTDFGMSLKPG